MTVMTDWSMTVMKIPESVQVKKTHKPRKSVPIRTVMTFRLKSQIECQVYIPAMTVMREVMTDS